MLLKHCNLLLKIIVSVFLITIFSSCSIGNKEVLEKEIKELKTQNQELINNTETLKSKVSELEEESNILLFDNNIRCFQMEDEINSYLVKNSKTLKDTIRVERIFYSSKYNSCLYIEYSHMEGQKYKADKDGKSQMTFQGTVYTRRLFDVLDRKNPIEQCLVSEINRCEKIEKLMEEIK